MLSEHVKSLIKEWNKGYGLPPRDVASVAKELVEEWNNHQGTFGTEKGKTMKCEQCVQLQRKVSKLYKTLFELERKITIRGFVLEGMLEKAKKADLEMIQKVFQS